MPAPVPASRRPRPVLLALAVGALAAGLLGPVGSAAASPAPPTSPTPPAAGPSQAGTVLHLAVHRGELIATVEGPADAPAPAGEVEFTVGGTALGSADLVADPAPGVAHATLPTAATRTRGPHAIRATWAGDEAHAGSEAAYDRTDPVVTVALASASRPNAAGWYRRPVTATFTCTAGSAHVVEDRCLAPVTRRRASGMPDREVWAVDGGWGPVSMAGLRVDPDAPSLATRRVGTAPYGRGARPVRCTAADTRSGLAGRCGVSYGELRRGPRGGLRRTWTATATDVAGNHRTRTGTFVVRG